MIEAQLYKSLLTVKGTVELEVALTIEKGEFITLYGDSGAGKTTILRMLAGLLRPDRGKIIVHNQVWYDYEKKTFLSPQKRKIGFLFQDYALFPNMTVEENISFGATNKEVVDELIQTMGLHQLRKQKPSQLSGGQQQRVALARAIAPQPEVLLLDEPLSALDEKTRYNLQTYIRQLHEKFTLTTVLVSHDHSEMLRLSDKVMHLEHGKIIKQGHPSLMLVKEQISGKFQLTGTIVKVDQQGFVSILYISTGNDIVKVMVDAYNESYEIGEKVLVASKAFNPIIMKISS